MKNKLFLLAVLAITFAACRDVGKEIMDSITELNQERENTKADFTYSISGRKVTFKANCDLKTKPTYDWYFGDNKGFLNYTNETATHEYAADGTYDVTMTYNWTHKGSPVSKDVTKTISVNSNTSGGEHANWTKAYIKGFRYDKIPNEFYYYKIVFKATGIEDISITTNEVSLQKGDLPYTYTLQTPKLLYGGSMAFHTYWDFTLSAYNHYYSWSFSGKFFEQSAAIEIKEIDGKDEYVFLSSDGKTQIAILFEYE